MQFNTAIILAGGKGKRLLPYTQVLPKPLMPIGKDTIISNIIKKLIKSKINNIKIATNYQSEIIQNYCNQFRSKKTKIDYYKEKKFLGTIGPLKNIRNLPQNFLLINGDVYTNLNFSKMMIFHKKKKNLLTIASKEIVTNVDYGVINIDKDNLVKSFLEKPKNKIIVSMGAYIINKDLLKFIPTNKKYGFDNLMKKMIMINEKISVFNHSGYWYDLGRSQDLIKVNNL